MQGADGGMTVSFSWGKCALSASASILKNNNMLLKMKANEEHFQKIKHREFSSVVLEMRK